MKAFGVRWPDEKELFSPQDRLSLFLTEAEAHAYAGLYRDYHAPLDKQHLVVVVLEVTITIRKG